MDRNPLGVTRELHPGPAIQIMTQTKLGKKRNLVRNFDYIPSLDTPSCRCKTCLATKAERAPFPHEAKSRAPKPGIRLHFDHKEVRAASRRGYHFRVTCTDDHTRYELSEHVKSVRNLYQLVERAVEFYERLGWE